MDKLLLDIMARILSNPLVTMHEYFTEVQWTKSDKAFFANCGTIRSFIALIIESKKKAKDSSASDVVSLILEDESY